SVCFVSETATALNGAPVTTFPPCIPANPSNSTRMAAGPNATLPSGLASIIIASGGGGGRGGGSCARTLPAFKISIPPRTKPMHSLRFIVRSPLLSRAAANSLPRQISFSRLFDKFHSLRQPIISDQQIHQDHIPGALFIYRQAKSSQSAPLHAYTDNCGIVGSRRKFIRQQSKFACAGLGGKSSC